MKLRNILAGTAIVALAAVTGAGGPLGIPAVTQAEAAVSISFSVFYDELASHGDWVRYHDAYVFIPADIDDDWRPYTHGHWVHTERYGWTWVSDEPFGWATYHYGRWGFAEDIGWYWVHGTRWAPAWVSWRRSNDYIVWAPLPPSGGGAEVSVSITVGDIPEFYWVAVPARQFLAPDIQIVIVHEDREIREVIERTEFVGAPRVTNNIVVNNAIDIDVVAKATGQEVKTVEVRETDNPREAKATDDQVTVFQGEVAADKEAKPKDVREVSEVKKAKRGGKGADDAAGTEPIPEPDANAGTTKAPESKPEKPAAESGVTTEPPAKTAEEPADESEEQQPAKSKAKSKAVKKVDEPAEESVEQLPAEGKAKGKAEKKAEEPADEATGSTTAPEAPAAEQPAVEEEQGQGKAKAEKQKKGQDKACDPEADPNCKAAQ